MRSEERWTQTRKPGGRLERQARQSLWVWAASAKLDGHPAGVIYQGGHRRWGIENKAFNELTQGYHLEHCYHHEPVSMLAQMLLLLWGFLLFGAFAQRHSKLVVLGKITAKALAKELDLALEKDLPWEQWFQSGHSLWGQFLRDKCSLKKRRRRKQSEKTHRGMVVCCRGGHADLTTVSAQIARNVPLPSTQVKR